MALPGVVRGRLMAFTLLVIQLEPESKEIQKTSIFFISCRDLCIPQCVIVYNSKRFSISCRDLRIPQCVIVYNSKNFLLL